MSCQRIVSAIALAVLCATLIGASQETDWNDDDVSLKQVFPEYSGSDDELGIEAAAHIRELELASTPTKEPTSDARRRKTKAPTKEPTSATTKAPTKEPTSDSRRRKTTKEPTKAPTSAASTKKPTSATTKAPTKEPTSDSRRRKTTKEPTKAPTSATDSSTDSRRRKTKAPTKEPTSATTKSPTSASTKKPTTATTKKPTPAPSKMPTRAPTKEPTKEPTKMPTRTPTKEPTQRPTESAEQKTVAAIKVMSELKAVIQTSVYKAVGAAMKDKKAVRALLVPSKRRRRKDSSTHRRRRRRRKSSNLLQSRDDRRRKDRRRRKDSDRRRKSSRRRRRRKGLRGVASKLKKSIDAVIQKSVFQAIGKAKKAIRGAVNDEVAKAIKAMQPKGAPPAKATGLFQVMQGIDGFVQESTEESTPSNVKGQVAAAVDDIIAANLDTTVVASNKNSAQGMTAPFVTLLSVLLAGLAFLY